MQGPAHFAKHLNILRAVSFLCSVITSKLIYYILPNSIRVNYEDFVENQAPFYDILKKKLPSNYEQNIVRFKERHTICGNRISENALSENFQLKNNSKDEIIRLPKKYSMFSFVIKRFY